MKNFKNIILKNSWNLIIKDLPLKDMYDGYTENDKIDYTIYNIVFNDLNIYSNEKQYFYLKGETGDNSRVKYDISPRIVFSKRVNANLINSNKDNIIFDINIHSILMPIKYRDYNSLSYKITIDGQITETKLLKENNTNIVQLLDLED